MRAVWLILLALVSTSACAAETPVAKTPSTANDCSVYGECTAEFEHQKIKLQRLQVSEELLEAPEQIKERRRNEYFKAQEERIMQNSPYMQLEKYYTKEELNQLSEMSAATSAENSFLPLSCKGIIAQGGLVNCQTAPNAKVKIARSESDFYYESADAGGRLLIGFDRDETTTFIESEGARISFDFEKRKYDTSRIDGLPPSQVSTFTEAQLKRIRSSSARKKIGFASRADELGFADGFTSPMTEFRKTTNFGAQRILNGEPKKPHYGVDMAAPVGTPIYAPADGVVSLSDDDLYFEGARVLLDHGQGLISMYLHVDETMVEPGQQVKRGEQIATVGSKGRSTGPHLCWRLKWRNRNLDPELLTQWSERAETIR